MIPKHINYFHVFVLSLTLFFSSFTVYADLDNLDTALITAHKKAMQSFKNFDVINAVNSLDLFFNEHSYSELNSGLPVIQYAEILNDYAYFMQMYYEEQVKSFCKGTDNVTVKDFLIFRSQMLDKSREILEFVLKIQPNRTVAYLNLADVLYNLDFDEQADANYRKYAELMEKEGKARKIPKRVTVQSARKKLHKCN